MANCGLACRRLAFSSPVKPVFLSLSAAMATTQAAPAPKVARMRWEYAVFEIATARKNGEYHESGSRLFLPGRKSVFLPGTDVSSPAYKAEILNRLGVQGWELVTRVTNQETGEGFVFKRRQ